ncbi:unnamed protein product [Prunus armeniaca]
MWTWALGQTGINNFTKWAGTAQPDKLNGPARQDTKTLNSSGGFSTATAVTRHHPRWHQSQKDCQLILLQPQPSPAASSYEIHRKMQKIRPVFPKLQTSRSLSILHQFGRIRLVDSRFEILPVLGSRCWPLPVTFWGRPNNKSDSKWGFTPRVGVLARDFEVFPASVIALHTHTLPGRGHCSRA